MRPSRRCELLEDGIDRIQDRRASTEEQVAGAEIVRRAADRLDQEDGANLSLLALVVSGMDSRAMCARLCIGQAALYQRLHRARTRFKRCLRNIQVDVRQEDCEPSWIAGGRA